MDEIAQRERDGRGREREDGNQDECGGHGVGRGIRWVALAATGQAIGRKFLIRRNGKRAGRLRR